jgi:hypothetical protein
MAMHKKIFYTLWNVRGKVTPVKVNGYNDGTFYYYKNEKWETWYAIVPGYGHSIANANTRTECARIAHSMEQLERFVTLDPEKIINARNLYKTAMVEKMEDSNNG